MKALHTLVDRLESDRSLLQPQRLRERIDVLDRLENHLAYGPPGNSDADPVLDARLLSRVENLCAGLEAANERLYESIRREIRRGMGPEAMLAWAPSAGSNASATREADGDRYDHLDALLSGVLQLQEPVSEPAELDAEMVFYQPTPARHIFEFIRRSELAAGDTLVDLGSGLGHVPLLAAICTGARCIGVEREAVYIDCATRCAQALGLANASFVRQDAREADLSTGNVFYLYTPFIGAILGAMLARLEREANMREIRIATLGPCTPVVARQPWLASDDAPETDRLVLFRSVAR